MKEDEQLTKEREYLVVKGNELIQKNRFELSLPEQKTVAYICSMIKPLPLDKGAIDKEQAVSTYQLEYKFDIQKYCKICGIDYNNGKNYVNVKATLKKLRDRSMWVTLDNGAETTVSWFDRVTTNKRSGIATVRIDDRLAPYLFDLGQKFTQYQLYNILGMKSAFSVRIYELMKSYAYQGSKTFEIDELKHLLMVDTVKSYNRFPSFRQKVLEPAQNEINELTDLCIGFEPITKGRKVVKLKFTIQQKALEQRLSAASATNMRLDSHTTA